jgi:subtilisin family serine protease
VRYVNRSSSVAVLVAIAGLVAGLAPHAFAAEPTPSPVGSGHIEAVDDAVPGQYIVTLRTPGSQAPATADALTSDYGGTVVRTYTSALSGFAARMSRADALALSGDPSVASVTQDAYVHATATESPVPSWGLDRIDQRAGLNGAYRYNADGTGVTAYLIDTGIRYTNTDFGHRATLGADFVGGVTPAGSDCDGHGTHVAGTIGGTAYGVAKNVSLVSVRVLDCDGAGLVSTVIAGVDWVTHNHHSPAVANMSLGGNSNSSLDAAVQNSIASGVTYAVAAGNGGVDACVESPASVPAALTVAVTDHADAQPPWSNFGSCVDLFAPGVEIVSDWNSSDTATTTLSGTSMSTAHVTGTAALYLQANPASSPAQVASALTVNATAGSVQNIGPGSPNLLDYSAFVVANHITRIFGNDAVDTAIATSRAGFRGTDSAGAVVLARSDFFADALAGGPLAAARGGPLLIQPGAALTSALDSRVSTEIQRVLPAGATVYILGGPIALSPSIDGTIAALGYHVTRIQGDDQFATAVAIAEELGNPSTIFEATGLGFADALSAVPAAIQLHAAIVLTDGTNQAPATADYLAAHPASTRYAIGGPLAAAGADPAATAVWGADLFDTSAAVAARFFPRVVTFGVATGLNFPDALAGGVFTVAAGLSGPVLLVRTHAPLPGAIAAYLGSSAAGAFGAVFGGPLAIGDDALFFLALVVGV